MGNEEKNLQDFTGAGEKKVAGLLGSLRRVEAPGDFDTRVRARIAKGKPSFTAPWLPILVRVGAPLALLAIIGGYFGYNAFYRQGNIGVPEVVETQEEAPGVVEPQPSAQIAPSTGALQTPEFAVVKPAVNSNSPVAVSSGKMRPSAINKAEQPGGGSVDQALRETNTVVPRRPSGDVQPTVNSSPSVPAATLSVRDVFGAMGIRASYSGSGWRVSSASGAAAKAGMQAGDIIEAVNGQPVGANTVFNSGFVGHSIRVKRNGASVQIAL